MPSRLKRIAQEKAQRLGLSLGAYLRGLIEADAGDSATPATARFPFGEQPIHTGRRDGSVDHDRPE